MSNSVLTEALIKQRTKLSSAEVRKLDLWGYQLSDISLIEKMKKLEIASLSLNNITTLKHFKNCTKLRDLFLRNNKISDFNELTYLSELPSLQTLWLSGNPIASEPLYREKVMQLLPKLSKLDEDEITEFERMETLKNSNALKKSGRKVSMPPTQSFPDIEINEKNESTDLKAKSQPLKTALGNNENVHSSRAKSSANSSKLSNSSKVSISSNLSNSSKSSNSPRIQKSVGNLDSSTESQTKGSSNSISKPPTTNPPSPPKVQTKPQRKNDKPLLNAILQLLPELSQESLDFILQNAQKYKNK